MDLANNDGRTTLHDATRNGHVDVCALLLDRGAEVDAVDNDGCTALHGAARFKNGEVMCVLMDCGADVSQKDGQGRTVKEEAHASCVDEETLQALRVRMEPRHA